MIREIIVRMLGLERRRAEAKRLAEAIEATRAETAALERDASELAKRVKRNAASGRGVLSGKPT